MYFNKCWQILSHSWRKWKTQIKYRGKKTDIANHDMVISTSKYFQGYENICKIGNKKEIKEDFR
jgi:hypothetical protein